MTDTYSEPNTSDHKMNTNQLTATRIKEERLRLNYTQQSVADHLGMNISNYSRLENGKYEITIAKLEAIAEFFKVPLVNLINSTTSNNYHFNNCIGVNNGHGTLNQTFDQTQFTKSIELIFKELENLKNSLKK